MANKQTPIDYIKDNLFYPIQLNQLKRVLNEAEQMHKEQEYETKAFWFGRGVLAEKENRIEELKPTK